METCIKGLIALSLMFSLSSCLNDDEHFVDFASAGYIAEIPYAANRSILKTVSIPASSSATTAPIDLNIASPNPPTQSIPITVGIDETALTAYNTANNTTYALLPAAAYQLTNPTVTVTAGQRIATVTINFVGTQIPATGGPYAVPVSIATVPENVTISANYRTQILVVSRTQ